MDTRRWLTILFTLLAMPIGGFALAFGLSRLFAGSGTGWGDLIGLVTGLLFGPTLGNILVFSICLLTLLRHRLQRPWGAWGINIGAALVALIAGGIALAAAGRTENWIGPTLGIAVALAVAGVGAWFALHVGGQRAVAPAAADQPAATT